MDEIKLQVITQKIMSFRKRTRQNLNHLTPEEKKERRRLKNRIAAQSARERKRVNLELLASKVDELSKQKEKLFKQMKILEQNNRSLREQNGLLKVQLMKNEQDHFNHSLVNLNEQFEFSSSLGDDCDSLESEVLIN